MPDLIMTSIFSETPTGIEFLVAATTAILLGLIISVVYKRTNSASSSMSGALVFLPFLVQVVIMLVNGNVGAGVAVMGAFSLIRFRSAPGSARDIAIIFLAMTVGLACGMGFVGLAVLATLVVLLIVVLGKSVASNSKNMMLKITVPEDIDYANQFDSVLAKYTDHYILESVKTVNMGSMYSLKYLIHKKSSANEKEMIDELRCRNGNLEISLHMIADNEKIL